MISELPWKGVRAGHTELCAVLMLYTCGVLSWYVNLANVPSQVPGVAPSHTSDDNPHWPGHREPLTRVVPNVSYRFSLFETRIAQGVSAMASPSRQGTGMGELTHMIFV